MGPEEAHLWAAAAALWEAARSGDLPAVEAALHPDYSGWVTGQPAPHDRAAAIASVAPGSPRILTYRLEPLSVRVFDGTVGVVHYRYEAEVEGAGSVRGRWTEVYLRHDGRWRMIAVSGGPDGQR